jgi:Flp pilus assembly pilin Flp
MNKMFLIKLKTFLKEESGASMVEYAVALLVVTAIGVGTMTTLGTETGENVTSACQVLDDDGSC